MHVIRSILRQEETNMAEARLDHVSRLGYREKPASRTTTTTTTTTNSLRVQCTYMYFCRKKDTFSLVLFYIKQTKSANIYLKVEFKFDNENF